MGVEKMACCGALTRAYSDAGNRKHNPGCRWAKMKYQDGDLCIYNGTNSVVVLRRGIEKWEMISPRAGKLSWNDDFIDNIRSLAVYGSVLIRDNEILKLQPE